jgi:hypothetical protein
MKELSRFDSAYVSGGWGDGGACSSAGGTTGDDGSCSVGCTTGADGVCNANSGMTVDSTYGGWTGDEGPGGSGFVGSAIAGVLASELLAATPLAGRVQIYAGVAIGTMYHIFTHPSGYQSLNHVDEWGFPKYNTHD